ncbi:hypothetical protein [Microbulbifer variabilis]|uniref:hypothetical protein n=1 Tax=Microbulbifer variabilis TaxID=266805 RepID=UPI001CFC912A|nr:hypothetical protein [Microbulbifer variabilis]
MDLVPDPDPFFACFFTGERGDKAEFESCAGMQKLLIQTMLLIRQYLLKPI